MAALELDEGPRDAFYTVEPLLTDFLGKDSYRLGGGTALEARWHHRISTDIDVFVDPGIYVQQIIRRREDFYIAADALSPSFLQVMERSCELHLSRTSVTVVTANEATNKAWSQDWVSGTKVRLESNEATNKAWSQDWVSGTKVRLESNAFSVRLNRSATPLVWGSATKGRLDAPELDLVGEVRQILGGDPSARPAPGPRRPRSSHTGKPHGDPAGRRSGPALACQPTHSAFQCSTAVKIQPQPFHREHRCPT